MWKKGPALVAVVLFSSLANAQFPDINSLLHTDAASNVSDEDVNDHVVDGALTGLFYTSAQQEKEIRTNPAARVTDLLKGVFESGG